MITISSLAVGLMMENPQKKSKPWMLHLELNNLGTYGITKINANVFVRLKANTEEEAFALGYALYCMDKRIETDLFFGRGIETLVAQEEHIRQYLRLN